MAIKYKASEQCISAEDARFIAALNEYTINQTKRGAYKGDIRSTRIAKDAINFVLDPLDNITILKYYKNITDNEKVISGSIQ